MECKSGDQNYREIVDEIANGLSEFQAKHLIESIVSFIGPDKAKDAYNEALLVESRGGMTTSKGDKRKSPGGVFFQLVKRNLSFFDKELLFPSGNTALAGLDALAYISNLSDIQLEIGLKRIEYSLSLVNNYIKKECLLSTKQTLLAEKDRRKTANVSNNIVEIRKAVGDKYDETTKNNILKLFEQLECLINEKSETGAKQREIEIERERMRIQLEAEERRTKNKYHFVELFMAKESAASIIGSLLLVVITIGLLIGAFTNSFDAKYVENGFLVLLGYFFGQGTKAKSEKTITEGKE